MDRQRTDNGPILAYVLGQIAMNSICSRIKRIKRMQWIQKMLRSGSYGAFLIIGDVDYLTTAPRTL